jgi:hypothetical protein
LHHFLDLWVLALELGISSRFQSFRKLPVDWQVKKDLNVTMYNIFKARVFSFLGEVFVIKKK